MTTARAEHLRLVRAAPQIVAPTGIAPNPARAAAALPIAAQAIAVLVVAAILTVTGPESVRPVGRRQARGAAAPARSHSMPASPDWSRSSTTCCARSARSAMIVPRSP